MGDIALSYNLMDLPCSSIRFQGLHHQIVIKLKVVTGDKLKFNATKAVGDLLIKVFAINNVLTSRSFIVSTSLYLCHIAIRGTLAMRCWKEIPCCIFETQPGRNSTKEEKLIFIFVLFGWSI